MKGQYQIDTQLIQRINAEQAFHYRIVPLAEQNEGLLFKTDNPELDQLRSELHIVLDTDVLLELVSSEEIQNLLTANYRQSQNTSKSNLAYSPDFLEKILVTANAIGSSDIHFEAYEQTCRIRFRLDGKLVEQFPFRTTLQLSIKLKYVPTLILLKSASLKTGEFQYNLVLLNSTFEYLHCLLYLVKKLSFEF